jgi:hypothetical protein
LTQHEVAAMVHIGLKQVLPAVSKLDTPCWVEDLQHTGMKK